VNKIVGFWVACSLILFLLSLVYLHNQLHRKNSIFAWWLCLGVSMQLISAYGLVLGCPTWLRRLWSAADVLSFALAVGVLLMAYARRSCPVNQALLYGIGAMIVLNVVSRTCGDQLTAAQRGWLVNIAFFGPAIFLLLMFSNVRADRLPLYLNSALRSLSSAAETMEQPVAARSRVQPR
jgi:hypothetical protein